MEVILCYIFYVILSSSVVLARNENYHLWNGNITDFLSETEEDLEILCAAKCSNVGAQCVGYTYETGNCGLVRTYTQVNSVLHPFKLKLTGTKILIVGGMSGVNTYTPITTNTVEIISIKPGETCNSGQNINIPTPLYAATGQNLNGYPTVCGGVQTGDIASNLCYSFDTNDRKWNALPNMLKTQSWGGSAISDKTLFIMASYNQADTQFYDGTKWTLGANAGYMPSRSCGVQLDPDRSMITGGDYGGITTATKIYSRSTKTWTSGPNMIVSHNDHGCATMADGKVMVVGGSSPQVTEILDPATMKWTRMPNSTVMFHQPYLVIAGGVPILTGGDGTTYKGVYKWENNTWIKLNVELKQARNKHVAFTIDSDDEC